MREKEEGCWRETVKEKGDAAGMGRWSKCEIGGRETKEGEQVIEGG